MQFPSTHWSLLARATLHGDTGHVAALDEFCRKYRGAVVGFIQARGHSAAEAEDLAHDFFLHLMERSTLRRADAARGRFRSFLLGTLLRFLSDERVRRHAAKRGGGVVPVPLEEIEQAGDAPGTEAPADERFDREWAVNLLGLAARRMQEEYAGRGRAELFQALRPFLPGGVNPPAYEAVAAATGLPLAAVKTEIHRFRQRIRAAVREEVALTVPDPGAVDAEIAYLGRVLQHATT